MNLFRNVLFWIVLALVGALLAQVLLADPGYVLVRFRGSDYTTTVASGVAARCWRCWPSPGCCGRCSRCRSAAGAGIATALARAPGRRPAGAAPRPLRPRRETADQAAADERWRSPHAGRRRRPRAPRERPRRRRHRASRNSTRSANAMPPRARSPPPNWRWPRHRPTDALVALDAPAAQPLPPRGLLLRAHALAASGQSAQAYGLLGALRQQQALPGARTR